MKQKVSDYIASFLPEHGVTQVFFRAHGNDRPVQAIGRRAGFQAQLMGEAIAIELLP